MNKVQMVDVVSKKSGIDKMTVTVVITTLFEEIKKLIMRGETFTLQDFGTFMKKIVKERCAYNFQTRGLFTFPKHGEPFFKPTSAFRKEVMEPYLKKKQDNKSQKKTEEDEL